MKKFTIQILSTIISFFITFILFILGVFFISFISSTSTKKRIKNSSILEISLDNTVIESSSEKEFSLLKINNKAPIYLKDIIDLIHNAKNDDKICGISLKISNPEMGYAQVSEIRDALLDFKSSKKFIYSYGNDYSQKGYYLSSVADSLFLNPNSSIELTGLSSEILFFKNLGDKYGIDFNVIRHGDYKSAVEPYLRNDLSSENREQLTSLLNNIWLKISSDISSSRKIELNKLNIITDSLYGFIPELTLKNNLVDALVYESDYDNIIKKKINTIIEEPLQKVSLSDYNNNYQIKKNTAKDNKIAILYLSGEIFTGKESSNIHSQNVIKEIQKIKDDNNIKALVLRINSPGGSANASAEILHELLKLKEKKPIVTSFSDVAASGGYYIAMASDRIFAHENTITGSIGVLGMIPNIKQLANKVGVTSDYVSTNSNSMYYSLTQGASKDFNNILYQGIEATYNKFIGVVIKNRDMTYSKANALGGGRVWSGKEALNNGLIDEIGGLNDAINFAVKKAKLKSYTTVSFPQEKTTWESFLETITPEESNFETKISEYILEKELGKDNYKIYKQLKQKNEKLELMYVQPFELSIK